jgi:chromosome segregation ATPase
MNRHPDFPARTVTLRHPCAATATSEGGRQLSEDPKRDEGIRARGEEALTDLAQALLDNPIFGQAVTTAIGAGERAAHAQRTAMGALNIPAASDFERLEQRMRSLSARLESVEDQLDDALDELAALRRANATEAPRAPDRAGASGPPQE